jgi:site-specific DNA-adenine methylase
MHKRGDRVWIYTEDKRRDRADILVDVAAELRNLPVDSVILDCEMVWWKKGKPIPRREMMAMVVGKDVIRGEDIRANIFDCPFFEGKDLSGEAWETRQEALKKALPRDLTHLKRVRPIIVDNKKELLAAIEKCAKYPGSEGAMLKIVRGPGSDYDVEGRMLGWAKFKIVAECSVQIIGRYRKPEAWVNVPKYGKAPTKPLSGDEAFEAWKDLSKASRTWIYRVAVLGPKKKLIALDAERKLTPSDLELRWVVKGQLDPFTKEKAAKSEWRGVDDHRCWEMGLGFKNRERGDWAYAHTYASALEPEPKIGDIISVQPVLFREWYDEEGKPRYSWTFPTVVALEPAKRQPDDIETMKRVLKFQRAARESELREIVDVAKYDPTRASNEALADDWRIVCAWYATALDPRKTIALSEAEITTLATKIVREIVRRVRAGKMKHTFAPAEMRPASRKLFEIVRKRVVIPDELIEASFAEGVRQIIGSPGGKHRIAHKICRFIPDHKTYVEPFCGGAAVFFAKRKAQHSILNDLDPEIMALYKFIQKATPREFEEFAKKDWRGSEARFIELCHAKPKTLLERAYRTWYLSRFGWLSSSSAPSHFRHASEGQLASVTPTRLRRLQESLAGVDLRCEDGLQVLRHCNSPEVFAYLDPPYPQDQRLPGFFKFEWSEKQQEALLDLLSSFRGKFILSQRKLEPRLKGLLAKKKWHSCRIETSMTMGTRDKPIAHEYRYEYLIANFPLNESEKWLAESQDFEEAKMPTREEQRKALEKRIGDWYMIEQPKGKSFPWVAMAHERGLWEPEEREEILSAIREAKGDKKILSALWREKKMRIVRTSVRELCEAAQKVADAKGDVTAEINKHLIAKMPTVEAFQAALRNDLVVNRASVHVDQRNLHPSGEYLVGWTLDTPGAMIQHLKSGKTTYILRNKFTEFREKENILSQKKSPQPLAWLTLVTPENPVYWAAPGRVGATPETAGMFKFLCEGQVVYGVQKTDYHEYFFFFDDPKLQKRIGGRWGWTLIGGRPEYLKAPEEQFWLADRPIEQRPYIMTHDFEEELAKARKERIDMVWNFDTMSTLADLGYFKEKGLVDEYEEWKAKTKRPKKEAFWFRTKRRAKVATSREKTLQPV